MLVTTAGNGIFGASVQWDMVGEKGNGNSRFEELRQEGRHDVKEPRPVDVGTLHVRDRLEHMADL